MSERGASSESAEEIRGSIIKRRTDPEILARARAMRRRPTESENALWQHLRGRKLGGYKFRRQHPIGPYIADFFCHQARLVVEVDGESHVHDGEYDAERTAWLEAEGNRVLRFWNSAVSNSLEDVLGEILSACLEATSVATTSGKNED